VRAALLLLLLCAFGVPPDALAGDDGGRDPAVEAFWHGMAPDGGPSVRLHYFYSPSCPHCQAAKPFLDQLQSRLPWLEVERYSVKDDRDNARFYYSTAKSLGVEALSVPGFVFCREVRIGFDAAETTGADLERALLACREQRAAAGPIAAVTDTGTAAPAGARPGLPAASSEVDVPLVGKVDAASLSLPVLTLVLAGVDAFNPCAFFVLLFLLSLLVHAKSRARMLIIGGTFVLFSGLVYFVFMAAWLNVFLIAGELRAMTVAAGLLAVVVGGLNVKDYFLFKQGPSLSIPESAKPGLFRRMREVVTTGSLLPMLASTVMLAIVANSYELLCTAGFPMVYTRALTLAGLEGWQHYAWLAAYNVIYVLPLLAIVLVFTYTLGQRKLSESEGRLLKLVSGYMMLGFGLVLLLAPNSLTSVGSSLLVLAAALVLALLTRTLMPPAAAGRA
jgi:thiol-disulfide isomerase/thioredoxin